MYIVKVYLQQARVQNWSLAGPIQPILQCMSAIDPAYQVILYIFTRRDRGNKSVRNGMRLYCKPTRSFEVPDFFYHRYVYSV